MINVCYELNKIIDAEEITVPIFPYLFAKGGRSDQQKIAPGVDCLSTLLFVRKKNPPIVGENRVIRSNKVVDELVHVGWINFLGLNQG